MTETLFERYKEALRAGHVAVLRGRFEEAAAAYREAVSIAGDRAVPRTALGGVHLRLGDPLAALEAYDGALAVEPDDDASLLGRAQALVVLRRTDEAAATYDRLAGLRSVGDRLAEAVEAARRALAIEPTDERRERHAALVAQRRGTAGEPAAAGPAGDDLPRGGDGAPDAAAGGPPEPLADVPPAPPPPDPELLVATIEEAAARGDAATAATAALAAARAYRAEGHVAAAFDACLLGIAERPGDVELHLLLADLAADRGWTGQAGDTYRALLRLVDLDGDTASAEVVRAAAAQRLPGDPRFARG